MLMIEEYKPTYLFVNKYGYLAGHKHACRLSGMRYGERLKAARNHAGLSQQQVADAAGCSQPNVQMLEASQTASGSEFTVQFAKACGVRPEWLAMEQGDMVDGYVVEDRRIIHLAQVCERLPDYAVDQLVLQGDAMAQLIQKAKGQ